MKVLKWTLAIIVLLSLNACQNTVEGFGKDMQQNGQQLQNSMKKN